MEGGLCQGLEVEAVGFSWLRKGAGVVTIFTSEFPKEAGEFVGYMLWP